MVAFLEVLLLAFHSRHHPSMVSLPLVLNMQVGVELERKLVQLGVNMLVVKIEVYMLVEAS